MASNGNITVTEKKAFAHQIAARAKSVDKTLDQELENIQQQIEESVYGELQIDEPSESIKISVEALEIDIKDKLSSLMNQAKSSASVRKADIRDDYEQKAQEMRIRHQKEIEQLKEWYDRTVLEISSELETAEQQFREGPLAKDIEELSALKKRYEQTKRKELRAKEDAMVRAVQLTKQKGRIKTIVEDASRLAQEQVWDTDSREEAKKARNTIPTSTEVIEACKTHDGLMNLIARLNVNGSDRLLCAPEIPNDIKEESTVSDEEEKPISVLDEDDDEEEVLDDDDIEE